MAPQDTTITATYKIDPATDLDGDGIPDAWETVHFGGTGMASGSTDSDGDGASDLEEFLAGTDPKDPASKLAISAVAQTGPETVTLTWPAVAGRTYTIFSKLDLQDADWLPLVIGVPGTAPSCNFALPMNEPARFFRVQEE
jgi:hypothetical protein